MATSKSSAPRSPVPAPVPPAPTSNGPWPVISTATLSDRVYTAIRDRILSGAIESGEFVREVDVSVSLGVSRTPVREALARLEREGFLERMARRGYRVPSETVEQLLALYPIVAALEVLAGEMAFPSMDHETMKQLRELNGKMKEAARRRDVRAAIEANHLFHHVLSGRCGNDRLCALLDELRVQVLRLELWSTGHSDHVEEALQQHDDIIRAIERKDFPAALTILKANRLQTYTAFHNELRSAKRPKKRAAKR